MVPINTDLSLLRRIEAVITAKGEQHPIKPCGLRMVRIIWKRQFLEVLTRLILIPVSLGFPSHKPYLLSLSNFQMRAKEQPLQLIV